MLKKILMVLSGLILTMGLAFADVDVNKADQAALDGVKGIGPVMSKRIIDERSKNGQFKDWADFEKRVKGVGDKSAAKLSENGLTVNGKPMSGASSKSAASKKESKSKAAADPTDRKLDKGEGRATDRPRSDTRPSAANSSGTASSPATSASGKPRDAGSEKK